LVIIAKIGVDVTEMLDLISHQRKLIKSNTCARSSSVEPAKQHPADYAVAPEYDL